MCAAWACGVRWRMDAPRRPSPHTHTHTTTSSSLLKPGSLTALFVIFILATPTSRNVTGDSGSPGTREAAGFSSLLYCCMTLGENVIMTPTVRETVCQSTTETDATCVPNDDCNNKDDAVGELQMQLQCAEANNCVLRNNVDTLKAALCQLAAQLDLANNRLLLHEDMTQVQALHRGKSLHETDVHSSQASIIAEYERRITELHIAMKDKDEAIMKIRSEMVKQAADAEAFLRSSLRRKDEVILQLMQEVNELRIASEVTHRSFVKRK